MTARRWLRLALGLVTCLAMVAGTPQAAWAEDLSAPTISELDFTPKSVNLYYGAATVTVSVRLVDPSGVKQGYAKLDSDRSTQQYLKSLSRVSGTTTDGTWSATFSMGTAQATGPWTVSLYAIEDSVGNGTSGYFTHPQKLDVANTESVVPEPPTSVTAESEDGAATVRWSAPSANGSELVAYIATADPGGQTCTVAASHQSCLVPGLTNGEAYSFTVVATNGNGDSAPSASSNVVYPGTVPISPSYASVTLSDRQASIRWNHPVDGRGTAVTKYVVVASPTGQTCVAGQTYIDWLDANGSRTAACSFYDLTYGTEYTFSVYAWNKFGASAPRTTAPVRPLSGAPSAPTSVSATAGDGSATVQWQPPTNDGGYVEGYRVTATTSAEGAIPSGTCTTTALTCIIPGLTNGASYVIDARAFNARGTSGASQWQPTVTPRSTPGAPTDVVAVHTSDGIDVRWAAPSANGAAIDRYETLSSNGQTCLSYGLSCLFQSLPTGAEYTFRVRALNDVGWGPWSEPTTPILEPRRASGYVNIWSGGATWNGDGTATIVFNLGVVSQGPDAVESATIALVPPANATFLDATGEFECTAAQCSITTPVPSGTVASVLLRYVVSAPGAYALDAEATEVSPAPRSFGHRGSAVEVTDSQPSSVRVSSFPRFSTADQLRVSWAAADTESGVRSVQVQVRQTAFNGDWSPWVTTTSHVATGSLPVTMSAGRDHCIRVRALDWAGNASAWTSPGCSARLLDDRALTTSRGWTRSTGSAFWNSTSTAGSSLGRTLTLGGVRSTRIALLATRCPSCGTLEVRIGSTRIARVNLTSTTTRHRQLVTLPPFALRGGTLVLTVMTSSRQVRVDGIGIARS